MPHICIDEYKTASIQEKQCLLTDAWLVIFFGSIFYLQTKLK